MILLQIKQKNMQSISEKTEKRPQKSLIKFEDFEKLDVRVCTIIGVERVPNTDKLYKLTIATGIDERTCVSAIADKFSEERLIHRNIPFILNLEPRKIKGIESQAMILIAEGDENLIPVVGYERGAIII